MSEKSNNYKYLNRINSTEDFKSLPEAVMPELAQEIREELVERVSENGGHLASNLGVVEITMAIHRVFNTPHDHVIFDVGHQSYVHKILTGRREQMDTLRCPGGLSGFTNRAESEHDCFGAGHSSTSLSAALGFAISDKLNGSDAYTVAVIGDGAYTGGMIHEALNNCRKDLRLIIIMNENEMSISKNIGRFAKNLSRLRTRPEYFRTKKVTGKFLRRIPLIGKHLFWFVRGVKKTIKNALYGSNYFESMGLTYLGPIDGNDYYAVEQLLREAKKLDESVVLHLKTVKGKGYAPAETAPDRYHGMPPACADASLKTDDNKKTFSSEFGSVITDMAFEDSRICAITAAMCDGTGLNPFREAHRDRFFDVGIAEEHALTFAAGLAANGMRPFVAIYSSFLQRGYDNVLHDIALQNLPVTICIDRAGINACDGATHHGIFDVAFLSEIPGIKIYVPATLGALDTALREAHEMNAPCAVRYPSGTENSRIVSEFYPYGEPSSLGARCNYDLNTGEPDAVIITHGRIAAEALKAADILKSKGENTGIILLEILKPYDETAGRIEDLLPRGKATVLFLEEEIRNGGMGMILADKLSGREVMGNKNVKILAVDDNFVRPKKGETVYTAAGVSTEDIVRAING